MEQRVSLITLGVADLERSRKFYESLGWRRSMVEAEGIAFSQAAGMALALYPRDELAKDANIGPEGDGFGGISLAYNTRNREEVDAVLAEAKAAGAKILKPAKEASWGGYSGYFSDPDGFVWEVAWNPFFQMAEDGTFDFPTKCPASREAGREAWRCHPDRRGWPRYGPVWDSARHRDSPCPPG